MPKEAITKIDFNDQADPAMLLLNNATGTQNKELLIQSSVGNVLDAWSNGATDSISAGDARLSDLAAQMQGVTGDALTQLQGEYQTAQTQVSNINNQYSNVMQGGSTSLTDLTSVEAQNIQFCTSVVENQSAVTQMIGVWAG